MKKKEIRNLIIAAVCIFAALIVITCTIEFMMPVQRTTKAQTYDLECVAGRSRKPLQECKE